MLKLTKYALALIVVVFTAPLCLAQTTAVTLQVTDADGQSWNNGSWTASLYSPPGVPCCNYVLLGTSTSVPNQQQSGALNGSGGGSLTVTPNASISPAGTQWQFTFCSAAAPAPCVNYQVAIAGATQTVAPTPPGIRISISNPLVRASAYLDTEITGAGVGNFYFNMPGGTVHFCSAATVLNCTNWVVATGGVTLGGTNTWTAPNTFSSALNAAAGGSFAGTFTGSPTFSGNPIFSGNPALTGGGSLGGTWTGSPTLSGSPIFSGTPALTGGGTVGGTWGGAATWSGSQTYNAIIQAVGGIDSCGPRPFISVTCPTYNADSSGTLGSSTAINTALTACTIGQTLYFPPGNYKLDAQIAWTSTSNGCIVKGAGRATRVFRAFNQPDFQQSSQGLIQVSCSTCTWQDMEIDGNYGLNQLTGTHGTTNGTTTFTDTTCACFVAGNVGMTISIPGAGNSNGPYLSTIAGFTNSTTVTLTSTPATSIAGTATWTITTGGNVISDISATSTNVTFQGNYIHACDGDCVLLTGNSGPSGFKLFNNRIVGGINVSVIVQQGTGDSFEMLWNTIDCSNYTQGTSGQFTQAAINLQASGSGKITNPHINYNHIIACGGGFSWGIQAGPFGGLTMSGLQIQGNYIETALSAGTKCSTAGFISTPFTYGHHISNNIMNTHFFDNANCGIGDAAIELGGASYGKISENICYCESSTINTFILGDNGSGNLISGNVTYGLGEAGGIGISLQNPTSTVALIANGGSAITQSGTLVTVVVGSALPGWIQPGTSVAMCTGAAAPPTSCASSGYYGHYTVVDTNYSRAGGTFSYYDNQTTNAAACTTSCGGVYPDTSNNTVAFNIIGLPIAASGSNVTGLQIKGSNSSSIIENNRWIGNTVIGLAASGTFGIGQTGSAIGIVDSNYYANNTLQNVSVGWNGSIASTHNTVLFTDMNQVSTLFQGTGAIFDQWESNGVGIPAAQISTCGATLSGYVIQLSDYLPAVVWNATVTSASGTGTGQITIVCSATAGGNWHLAVGQ